MTCIVEKNRCVLENTVLDSHGPINCSEIIVLEVIEPDSWSNGKIEPKYFQTKKLKEGSLSVYRAQYASEDDINNKVIAPQIERNSLRKHVGTASVSALKIRELVSSENLRAFCIRNDPMEDFLAHAALGFCSKIQTKNIQSACRTELAQLFMNNFAPI